MINIDRILNLIRDDQIIENLVGIKKLPQYVKEMRSAEAKEEKEKAKKLKATK